MGEAAVGQAERAGPGSEAWFELERCELEDGRLVVSGAWHEVRGLRFVRPTLMAGDKEVLASLDHKPWDPGASPWVAAFPWPGDAPERDGLRLNVAPRVTVALSSGRPDGERFSRTPAPKRPRRSTQRAEIERLTTENETLRGERDQALEQRDAAVASRRRHEDEHHRLVTANEALRAERDDAIWQRDAAVAEQRREVEARERATARADRLEAERDRALKQRETALAELARTARERDEKIARITRERDEAVAQLERDRDDARRAADEEHRRREERERELALGERALAAATREVGPRLIPARAELPIERRRRLEGRELWLPRLLAGGTVVVGLIVFLNVLHG